MRAERGEPVPGIRPPPWQPLVGRRRQFQVSVCCVRLARRAGCTVHCPSSSLFLPMAESRGRVANVHRCSVGRAAGVSSTGVTFRSHVTRAGRNLDAQPYKRTCTSPDRPLAPYSLWSISPAGDAP